MKTLISLCIIFTVFILPEVIVFYLWQTESEIIWNFLIKLGGGVLVVSGVAAIFWAAYRSKSYQDLERSLRICREDKEELEKRNARLEKRIEFLENLIELDDKLEQRAIKLRRQGDEEHIHRSKTD